jgi:arginyl-tRNA synthetase
MAVLRERLRARLGAALEACGWEPGDASVSPASDPRFGDYQSNVAMVLAKREKSNPRVLASGLAEAFDGTGLTPKPGVAGAGFLNFRIETEPLRGFLGEMACDPRLGLEPVAAPLKILMDFSSPNVAKPMHVGHIRSTILGDCLARIARFVGHEVVTDNHIGDWGTQFGKVIHGWKHLLDEEALGKDPIAELVRLYREVNTREASDPAVASAARAELVALQSGDSTNLAIWKRCVDLSWSEFEKLYSLLDVTFDERLGESAYNDALAPLCEDLVHRGLAETSDGALCLFFRDLPALADKPLIVRKADGGFLYATTDLATIAHRVRRWNPDEIWYVVGSPQTLHFQQVFEAARRMGFQCGLRHIAFGSILGSDRKIMKTRSGDNVGLAGVLDEAVARAAALVAEKNPSLPAEERAPIARAVGIGAVKYAELSQNRLSDYVFAWDKMLSFQGNTAPYLQNAVVRIRSIFRKAGTPPTAPPACDAPEERALAIQIARHPETIPLVLDEFRPNLLANHLFELANRFHAFYEACPVLKAPPAVRDARLALCSLTARTLEHGLGLMGIQCPERM